VTTMYVTYGFGSNLENCYSRVEGEDEQDCLRQISEATLGAYAFTYTEKHFAGQVEQWGLREVPLQAQVRWDVV